MRLILILFVFVLVGCKELREQGREQPRQQTIEQCVKTDQGNKMCRSPRS